MNNDLFKSQKNKMIAGVCGGIAEFTRIDATIIRLAVAAIAFVFQPIIILYIIAAIVIPRYDGNAQSNMNGTCSSEGNQDSYYNAGDENGQNDDYDPQNTRVVLGGALILIGAGFLSNYMFPQFYEKFFWPFLFIAAGAAVIYTSYKK